VNRFVATPAFRTREVGHSIAVALQAKAAAIELQKMSIRRTVRIVALHAAPHQPAADRAMGEAEWTLLRRVAATADVADVPLPDLAVRIVAIGALDPLLVLDQNRVVAVQTKQPFDFVVTFNTNV
jgi:hypothetical protein